MKSRKTVDPNEVPIFSSSSHPRLAAVPQVTEMVTTDTVFIPPEKPHPKLHMLPVTPVFGEAIRHNLLCVSIGDLFIFNGQHHENLE